MRYFFGELNTCNSSFEQSLPKVIHLKHAFCLPHLLFGLMWETDKSLWQQFWLGCNDKSRCMGLGIRKYTRHVLKRTCRCLTKRLGKKMLFMEVPVHLAFFESCWGMGRPLRLTSFWKDMSTKSWMHDHPVKKLKDFHSLAVPLRVFGDAVAVLGLAKSWGRSIDALTLSSYLNSGDTKWAQIIMALHWKAKRHHTTVQKLWTILQWSLEALFHGKYPSRNFDGKPFAPGSWQGLKANQPLAGGHVGVVVAYFLVASNTRGSHLDPRAHGCGKTKKDYLTC